MQLKYFKRTLELLVLSASLGLSAACTKTPSFIIESPGGKVKIDYRKATNFYFDDRDALLERERERLMNTVKERFTSFKNGDVYAYTFIPQISGGWHDSGKSFLALSQGSEMSPEFNASDKKQSGFIFPDRDESKHKWLAHIILDSAWKKPIVELGYDGKYVKNNIKFRKVGKNLLYALFEFDDSRKMEFFVKGSLPHETTGFLYFSNRKLERFDWISNKQYEEWKNEHDPERMKEIARAEAFLTVSFALNKYRGEKGGYPMELQELVPGYIPLVPNFNWHYIPQNGEGQLELRIEPEKGD